MAKILVTGAGGYIGTVLVPMLLDAGHHVRAVDRFFFGRRLQPHARLEIVEEDVRVLAGNHLEGIDKVVDLVAISNDPSGERFREATWSINWQARAQTAELAKQAGVQRYLLPSSCSVYGFQAPDAIADEDSPLNPLTTYAKANARAERNVLSLADAGFEVVVLRQATVYGLSPRMRFDLAINGMTYAAWSEQRLPVMRDGTQWRPMLHVADAARAIIHMLEEEAGAVNAQIFNIGSNANNYQIRPLAETVAECFPIPVQLTWYGEPDSRSYRVSFDKLAALGWRPKYNAEDGVKEITEALTAGVLTRSDDTITLRWYELLDEWHKRLQRIVRYGGVLEIDPMAIPDLDAAERELNILAERFARAG